MNKVVRTDANVVEAAKLDIDWRGKILNNIMKLILKVSFTCKNRSCLMGIQNILIHGITFVL
jgi:hypothetical protein